MYLNFKNCTANYTEMYCNFALKTITLLDLFNQEGLKVGGNVEINRKLGIFAW